MEGKESEGSGRKREWSARNIDSIEIEDLIIRYRSILSQAKVSWKSRSLYPQLYSDRLSPMETNAMLVPWWGRAATQPVTPVRGAATVRRPAAGVPGALSVVPGHRTRRTAVWHHRAHFAGRVHCPRLQLRHLRRAALQDHRGCLQGLCQSHPAVIALSLWISLLSYHTYCPNHDSPQYICEMSDFHIPR